MSKEFDVVVIGGGPGGYIAAIRAAQLGFQVACIDEWKNAKGGPAPGGTCTNVGCIPSKALLQSSEHFDHANHHFAEHGIAVSGVSMDVAKMIARKDTVVKQNNDGILFLFKKNKITFFHGRGSFVKAVPPGAGGTSGSTGAYEISVAGAEQQVVLAKQVIVATGSNARALPGTPFDEENILSNDGALRLGAVPKKLGLIGSGVIGLEMGSVWRRLGSEVTILEGLPTFLGAVDEQVAKEAHKAFIRQGLKIELGVKVGEVKAGKKGVSVAYTNAKGEALVLDVDKLIVSIGRVPNTTGLNSERPRQGQLHVDLAHVLEFGERRQVVQRLQAEVVEELAGSAEQLRMARHVAMPDDANPVALHQGLQDVRVHRHAAHGLDLGTGNRLSIGNQREGLEQGTRIALRALGPETADLGREVGTHLDADAARRLLDLDATTLVGGHQRVDRGAQGVLLGTRGLLEKLREFGQRQRTTRGEQRGFDDVSDVVLAHGSSVVGGCGA